MKLLQKILMAASIALFLSAMGAFILTDAKILTMALVVVHSLCLIAFAYLTITFKDPDMDSQRLSNLLQQSEAKYEEYKKDTESTIRKKEEIISAMSAELEEYKKGLR